MKVLQKAHIVRRQQSQHTMTERAILAQCMSESVHDPLTSSAFIVRLKFAYQTATTLNLVMEYCSGGELFFHLSKLGKFPVERARFYGAELTLALEHLHHRGIVYRDLKPENILIDLEGHIKLVDFGLCKLGVHAADSGGRTFCGTPEYVAREILAHKEYGNAVDWWALGVLLYEMITGLPPWYSRNRQKLYHGIQECALTFPDGVPEDARSLIRGLLIKDPTETGKQQLRRQRCKAASLLGTSTG